jgi:hypothetical protein
VVHMVSVGNRGTYLDLVHKSTPKGNPLGNPKLDSVEEGPLVFPVDSLVHNRGCHAGMLLDRCRGQELTLTPNPAHGSRQAGK